MTIDARPDPPRRLLWAGALLAQLGHPASVQGAGGATPGATAPRCAVTATRTVGTITRTTTTRTVTRATTAGAPCGSR